MHSKLNIQRPLVSAEWLVENLDAENLVIVEARLEGVIKSNDVSKKKEIGLKNARLLDVKNVFSDTTVPFPNTMLSAAGFQEQAQLLGINKDTAIVVYDTKGIYSGPRVWWMFKSMGHENIAVLDGGLPEWIKKGYATTQIKRETIVRGNFTANYNESFFYNHKDVLRSISNDNVTIVDARSKERFMGLVEEPREGLRVGHIPNARNIPYTDLQVNGKMLEKDQLVPFFETDYKNKQKVIFSCGSGITACILALGAEICEIENVVVYDGSWTEWGSKHELPIEK